MAVCNFRQSLNIRNVGIGIAEGLGVNKLCVWLYCGFDRLKITRRGKACFNPLLFECVCKKIICTSVKENCLVEQQFVMDGDITVGKYIENTAKALGADVKLVSFVRFEKGEGIEKRVDDFAAEVAGMVK